MSLGRDGAGLAGRLALAVALGVLPLEVAAQSAACPDCATEVVLSPQGVGCLFERLEDDIRTASATGLALVDLRMCQARRPFDSVPRGNDMDIDPLVHPPEGDVSAAEARSPAARGDAPAFFLLAHWQLLCLRTREAEIRADTTRPIVVKFVTCPQRPGG